MDRVNTGKGITDDAHMAGNISCRWLLLSLCSAILLIFTFPSPAFPVLGWIALVPLFIVIQQERFVRVLGSAVLTSLVFNVFYIWWVKEYKHPLALSGAVFAEIVYFVPAVLLSRFLFQNVGYITVAGRRARRKRRRTVEYLRPLMIPLGWIALDYLKTIGFLSFPWGILAYSQFRNRIFIQSASVFGIWGVDFIMLYWNAVVSFFILHLVSGRRDLLHIGMMHGLIGVLLIGSSYVYGVIKLSEEKKGFGEYKRIALIQANLDPWTPQVQQNLAVEMKLTRDALAHDPDIVIWSESSVPFYYRYHLQKGNKYAKRVHDFVVDTGVPFVFGTVDFEGERIDGKYLGDFYNVAIYYNGDVLKDVYRKIHLVPFGEWFPYGRIFPFVKTILENAGAGDFEPGRQFTIFKSGELHFNVLICFEDAFGNLARKFVIRGSGLIVNITNDAWTGSAKAEIQHYIKAIFRSIENRRSLVRAANGGVTACVNPYGREIARLPLFTSDYLVCDVPVYNDGPVTFYSRFGDLPMIALFFTVAAFFLFLLWLRLYSHRSNADHPNGIGVTYGCDDSSLTNKGLREK